MRTVADRRPGPWSRVDVSPAARLRFAGVAVLAYACGVVVRSMTHGLDPWVAYEYLLGYSSHGFVRRGLVGTAVGPWVQSPRDVVAVAVLVSIITGLTTLLMLDVVRAHLPDRGQRDLVAAACVPVFSQIGWDLGRQDMLLLPLLIGVVVLVRSGRTTWVPLLLVGGLVHEHFIAWVLVVVVAGIVLGWTDVSRAAPTIVGGLGLALVLALHGSFEGSTAAFAAALPAWAPSADTLVPRLAPWTGTPTDALEHVRQYVMIGGWVATAALLVSLAVCARVLARRLDARISVAVALPTIALATVGTDHMRWAFWLLVLTGLLLAAARALPALGRQRLVPTVVILLLLGPPGHVVPFPYWTAT